MGENWWKTSVELQSRFCDFHRLGCSISTSRSRLWLLIIVSVVHYIANSSPLSLHMIWMTNQIGDQVQGGYPSNVIAAQYTQAFPWSILVWISSVVPIFSLKMDSSRKSRSSAANWRISSRLPRRRTSLLLRDMRLSCFLDHLRHLNSLLIVDWWISMCHNQYLISFCCRHPSWRRYSKRASSSALDGFLARPRPQSAIIWFSNATVSDEILLDTKNRMATYVLIPHSVAIALHFQSRSRYRKTV